MRQDRHYKKPKETWKDWVSDDALKLEPAGCLSQAEVLAWVDAWGHTIEPRTFKSWRDMRLLPSPTQKGKGATRVTRYPWWVVDLTLEIVVLRKREKAAKRKTPLKEFIPRLRIQAAQLAQCPPLREKAPPGGLARYLGPGFVQALHSYKHPDHLPSIAVFDPTAQPQPLRDLPGAPVTMLAGILARGYREQYGIAIEEAQLRLLGPNGEQVVFTIPLEEPSGPFAAPKTL